MKLTVQGLNSFYGPAHILFDIGLEVGDGEVVALLGNPSLVLLDEPSEGLSPKIVEQMVEAILTMKREGVSIVVSEQNLHFAKLISDRAYIIERGRICFSGTMRELDARPDVRDAHLAL